MADELRSRTGRRPPVAVEFVNSSLTSQNLDDKMGWAPLTRVARRWPRRTCAGMAAHPWVDFDSHGYNLIDVTPERVAAEWWAVDTVLRRTTEERRVATWSVANGVPSVVEGDSRQASGR